MFLSTLETNRLLLNFAVQFSTSAGKSRLNSSLFSDQLTRETKENAPWEPSANVNKGKGIISSRNDRLPHGRE